MISERLKLAHVRRFDALFDRTFAAAFGRAALWQGWKAILNLFLTICFYFPGMIHALVVVNSKYADRRTDRIVQAMRQR